MQVKLKIINEHLKPEKSRVHRHFLAKAKKSNFNLKSIKKMFWLINAHDQLIAFPLVCQNLKKALQNLKYESNSKDDELFPIMDWIEISKYVVNE